MHHFDKDLDPDERKARENFIEHREKQLQNITVSAAETGVKYLFTTNAGGAIAILTYLGAIATNPNPAQTLKISLVLFFFGVILIGIYHVLLVETYGNIFKKFQESTKNYFADKKEWDEYFSEIQAHVKPNNIPRILLYTSFGCFIFGCVFGALSLFSWCV